MLKNRSTSVLVICAPTSVFWLPASWTQPIGTRNRFVAGLLQQGGFATLLLDLLTDAEEQVDLRTGNLRSDIGLLAARLMDAADWHPQSLRGRPTPARRIRYPAAGFVD